MSQRDVRFTSDLAGNDYAPVLALTVFDARSAAGHGNFESASLLLVGVRDPETNSTHPNVLSVPTKRVPNVVLGGIEVEVLGENSLGACKTYILRELDPDLRANCHNNLFFAVKSILAEKLGIAEQLELGAVTFTTRLEALVVGIVKHPDLEEKTCMYNASVLLYGANHIPHRTSSYRSLIWTPVANFMKAAERKDLAQISQDLNPFEYCIHGLCVMSSFNLLTSAFGGQPYPFDEQEL